MFNVRVNFTSIEECRFLRSIQIVYRLGPMMEENLRRALLISRGDPMVFLQEPISLAFLVVAAGLLVVIAAPAIRLKREEALKE